MTSSDKERERKLRNIMSDHDFEALMEAEYEQHTKTVDGIGKKKVWNNVLTEINTSNDSDARSIFSIHKWFPITAVALLILSVFPLTYIMESENSTTRMKGFSEVPPVRLSAFSIDRSGTLSASRGVHDLGSTIVFKYDVTKPVSLALLMSRNGDQPRIRYMLNSAEPGNGVLLQRKRKTYGYMVDPLDKRIRFCIIAAENASALKKRLRTADQEWAGLAEESCVVININNNQIHVKKQY